jgi:hypothetical protein
METKHCFIGWLAGFRIFRAGAADRTGWNISVVQFQIVKGVKEGNK